jgi:hypothetical protein
VLNEVSHLTGGVPQGGFPKIPKIPKIPDIPFNPHEIPRAPVPPEIDVPLTFPQRQLQKFISDLDDGTFAKKQVKKAACGAMRDGISNADEKQAWRDRIYSYLPSFDSTTIQRVANAAVDNVAERLAAVGSDYGPVYVVACGI